MRGAIIGGAAGAEARKAQVSQGRAENLRRDPPPPGTLERSKGVHVDTLERSEEAHKAPVLQGRAGNLGDAPPPDTHQGGRGCHHGNHGKLRGFTGNYGNVKEKGGEIEGEM